MFSTFGCGRFSAFSSFVGLAEGFFSCELGAFVAGKERVEEDLFDGTLVGEKNLKTAQSPNTTMSKMARATTTFEGLYSGFSISSPASSAPGNSVC